MARYRTLAGEVWTHPDIRYEPLHVGWLYAYLITAEADDEGRFVAKTVVLADRAFSSAQGIALQQVEEALSYLARSGRVLLYEAGGQRLGFLTGWYEHQYIQAERRQSSALPPPPCEVNSWEVADRVRVSCAKAKGFDIRKITFQEALRWYGQAALAVNRPLTNGQPTVNHDGEEETPQAKGDIGYPAVNPGLTEGYPEGEVEGEVPLPPTPFPVPDGNDEEEGTGLSARQTTRARFEAALADVGGAEREGQQMDALFEQCRQIAGDHAEAVLPVAAGNTAQWAFEQGRRGKRPRWVQVTAYLVKVCRSLTDDEQARDDAMTAPEKLYVRLVGPKPTDTYMAQRTWEMEKREFCDDAEGYLLSKCGTGRSPRLQARAVELGLWDDDLPERVRARILARARAQEART